ncbi:MAG: hypothetical protein WA982_16840 [Rubrobacteraceae bacterium]
MNNLRPQILLAVLVGAVPLAVLCSGVVAFLLLRAGFGIFVWAVLPFLGLLVIVAVLGIFLSRAAGSRGGAGGGHGSKAGDEKPQRRNDV